MKCLSLIITLALAVPALAQESLSDELNDEISVLYPQTTLKKKPKKIVQRPDLDLEQRSVIINNNLAAPESVREQPATVVEATPVDQSVSKGQEKRKTRVDLEKNTEDVIVEKLELDRIEAEKERAKKAQDIFNKEKEAEKAAVVEVAPVAPVPVQEVPTYYVPPTQTVSSEIEKSEATASESTKMYVGLLGGVGDYTSAKNVQGKAAMGVKFGMEFPENFIVEAQFIHSQYDVNGVTVCTYRDPYTGYCGYSGWGYADQRMTQMNFTAVGKYAFLSGRVRPVVGGVLSYTRRDFEVKRVYNPYVYYPLQKEQTASSWGMDAGLLVGVDVGLSNKFHIGADLKYMMNLTFDRDELPYQRDYSQTQPIEELSYYLFMINGTFRF